MPWNKIEPQLLYSKVGFVSGTQPPDPKLIEWDTDMDFHYRTRSL